MAGLRVCQLEYIDLASGRTCVGGGAAEPPLPGQPVSRHELDAVRRQMLSLSRQLQALNRSIAGRAKPRPPDCQPASEK